MAPTHSGEGSRGLAAKLSWLESLVMRYRFGMNFLAHTFLFALSLWAAFFVRSNVGSGDREWFYRQFIPLLPYFLLLKILIFGKMRLFRGGWQYAGIRDVANILFASWVFLAVTFFPFVLFRYVPDWFGCQVEIPYVADYFRKFPKGVLLLDFVWSVFFICAARLGFRIYREELRPGAAEGVKRVLVVGAGDAAEAIIREVLRMRVERYRVVGLVDDAPAKRHIVIHGVPVLGTTDDLPEICRDEEIDEIIIAIPSATQKQLRRVIDLCSGTKLKFQSLPSVSDLIDGRVTVSQIRPVEINDLLGRQQVQLDLEAVGRFLKGRRVMVTGAGGSIGSEMCRQVCRFEPAELLLLEQAENPLFGIQNELTRTFPAVPVRAIIADIYDHDRIMRIWEARRPEVVIHAAAHKHVPLMENNPSEAIKNNVFGTKNVADASAKYQARDFVMISTDKAVNPSSIMGACKRVAEIYTQSLNARPECRTNFKAVRFGNVLGSAGSVVPTFRQQIAEGGPVRVTHPEMRRYFMTIPEASQLVLQAAATGAGGEVYLLDMGEEVKIVDLARQMITLSGFRPGEDIDIVFTGMRPGEKLFEELRTSGEDIEPTVHPKIMVWKHDASEWEWAERKIEGLRNLTNCMDRDTIVAAIKDIVPEYEPLNPPAKVAPVKVEMSAAEKASV